jgi:hypothetical protein
MRVTFLIFFTATVLAVSAPTNARSGQAAEPNMRARPDASSIGIWKAAVPHAIKAELDNYDPIGLIAGALIKTDCAFNWRDPDDGKLYCFVLQARRPSSISRRGLRPISAARTTHWKGWSPRSRGPSSDHPTAPGHVAGLGRPHQKLPDCGLGGLCGKWPNQSNNPGVRRGVECASIDPKATRQWTIASMREPTNCSSS